MESEPREVTLEGAAHYLRKLSDRDVRRLANQLLSERDLSVQEAARLEVSKLLEGFGELTMEEAKKVLNKTKTNLELK